MNQYFHKNQLDALLNAPSYQMTKKVHHMHTGAYIWLFM